MKHIRRVDRREALTVPARLDDWIEADHVVRAIDGWAERLDRHPEMVGRRRQSEEHPFGTLKERIVGPSTALQAARLG